MLLNILLATPRNIKIDINIEIDINAKYVDDLT